MKKLLSTLVLLFMAFMAQAATEINGIYYNLDSSVQTAEVTKNPNKYSGSVSIPSSVSYGGHSYQVTSIGNEAFYFCRSLTSITIPNSVTSIGNSAFYYCTSMTSVTIPNSVISIGNHAFTQCYDLTSITIPNSVESIGGWAFDYCMSLTSITIPNSVTSIGEYAFRGCSNLTSVTIPNSVESIGKYAFSDCTSLPIENNIRYADTYLVEVVDKNQSAYQIKDGTIFIGSDAFKNCSNLTAIDIPNSVTSIGYGAFFQCYRLTSITIPNSVTSIYRSFSSNLTTIKVDIANPKYDSRNNCNAIIETSSNTLVFGCKSTFIPNSVTSIGEYAFSGCSVTSITIPNSVTSIGEYAFHDCDGLTSITIPNSVTSIGSGAFYKCRGLTSITIPNSVTRIDSESFYDCVNLKKVNIADINAWCKIEFGIKNYETNLGFASNPLTQAHNLYLNDELITDLVIPSDINSIGDVTFAGISLNSITIPNSVTSIGTGAFYGCTSFTNIGPVGSGASVEISNNVKTIGNYAFSECLNLSSITIGNHVTNIGNYAFDGCSNLTSITIPKNVTSIGEWAFNNCSSLTSVTIPNSVMSIGWSAFFGCSSLTSVTVENPSPVSIAQYTFTNRANATLYVPTGSKSAYLAADYWKEFKEIIEKNMSHDAGLGDVNGDGEISISDVTLLVDYLLEQAGDNFILANADVNKDGRISVSDAVSIIKLILEGEPEPQAYLTCPDDHHPHMIDLGLPSGTKWACCNVGADKPEAYGGYYAWGETEEKSTYNWSTYIHCDGSQSTCQDLGSDIAGTQYDVAHVKWGGSWVMPSLEQIKELQNNCTNEWTIVNGINGRIFTSNINGGSIFLPAAGYRWYDFLYNASSAGHYRSSTQSPSNSFDACGLYIGSDHSGWNYNGYRSYGRSVRAVYR